MAFHGFSAEGVDLLQLNRLQNSKEFYDAHKDEIKRLSIRPQSTTGTRIRSRILF